MSPILHHPAHTLSCVILDLDLPAWQEYIKGLASRTISLASASALAPSSNLHSSACPLAEAKWSDVLPSCSSMYPWNDQYLAKHPVAKKSVMHGKNQFVRCLWLCAREWFGIALMSLLRWRARASGFDMFAHYTFKHTCLCFIHFSETHRSSTFCWHPILSKTRFFNLSISASLLLWLSPSIVPYMHTSSCDILDQALPAC